MIIQDFKLQEEDAKSVNDAQKIMAVVVTYNPCLEKVRGLLAVVITQVFKVLIIDNGSNGVEKIQCLVSKFSGAEFIGLSSNMGIAYAQNVGIRIAKNYNADYVLTLDQDSLPSTDLVRILVATFDSARDGNRIAAVGPLLLDESTRLPLPFFSYQYGKKLRIEPKEGPDLIDVEFLVSSGTMLAMTALVEVGLMREELFISYVDVEWCLRARFHGFQVLGCCAATMLHNLGERRLKIGRYLIPLHSPLRHYYVFRSGIYMQRLSNVSTDWKRADRRQLARSFILFGIVGLPSFQEFTSMCRGLKDGLSMNIQEAMRLQTAASYLEGVASSPVDHKANQPPIMFK